VLFKRARDRSEGDNSAATRFSPDSLEAAKPPSVSLVGRPLRGLDTWSAANRVGDAMEQMGVAIVMERNSAWLRSF